jgi:parallel beta-helix repeat protein
MIRRGLNGLAGVLVLLLCTGLSPDGWARSYHVSMTGDNANPGTEALPFRTIPKAARVMKPGDNVVVAAGVYPTRVTITRSGKYGSPITFEANGKVVMKGFTLLADYIRIVGFEITTKAAGEEAGAGIYLLGSSNEILGNYIHDLYFEGILFRTELPYKLWSTQSNLVKGNRIVRARNAGIHLAGHYNRIEENDISHTIQHPKGAPRDDGADADGIRFFGADNLIRGNVIHDILLSDKGNRNPHIDCFQTWGPAMYIIFDGNVCDNPNFGQQGWIINPDKIKGTDSYEPVYFLTMRNNVVRAFRLMNIFHASRVTVANNSFKGGFASPGSTEFGYGIELNGSPHVRVQNNLFYDIGGHVAPYMKANDLASEKGLIAGYNAAFMSDGADPAGTPYANDLWQQNPNVMDPEKLDFRVNPDSPLIDAGITLKNVKDDRQGVARPQGIGHDIGAYEALAGVDPG